MLDDGGSLILLCALTFAVGVRHGFDVDHLAVIDGIVRINAQDRPPVARWSGVLFSLGHGVVVVVWCGLAAALSSLGAVPEWLHWTGSSISIAFLIGLGAANVMAAVRAGATGSVQLVGFKSRFLGQIRRQPGVIAVGGLFALSFDTISQAALIGFAGLQAGGPLGPLLAGLSFVLGMMLVDGANGLWATQLLRTGGSRAFRIQRVMAFGIGAASMLLGFFMLAATISPDLDQWREARGAWLAGGAIAFVFVTFVSARLLTSRRDPLPDHHI